MKRLAFPLVMMTAVAGGCSTSGKTTVPLVANDKIQLTSKIGISMGDLASTVVGGLLIYLIYDPLAPNWEITESRLTDDTFHFDMKMKRYHTGGAGESMMILKRRAGQLQRELGYANYELTEYTEGINSETLGARRYAEGTIKLVQRQEAPAAKSH